MNIMNVESSAFFNKLHKNEESKNWDHSQTVKDSSEIYKHRIGNNNQVMSISDPAIIKVDEETSSEIENISKNDLNLYKNINSIPFVDLVNIPYKIEYINLIDPSEDYTMQSFNLNKTITNNNKKKLARNVTNKFEEINLITSENEEYEDNKNEAKEQKKVEERLNNSLTYNPYNSNNETKINKVERMSSKALRKETILVYSSDNKFETCDILWKNDIDNQIVPKWKYTMKCIVFDKRIAEFISAASDVNVTCDCDDKCWSYKDCACSLLNYAINKKDFSYCYDIIVKKGRWKQIDKLLISSFDTHNHVFECSSICNCNKEKCHLSLMNCFDNLNSSNIMKNFIIQRVRKSRIVNARLHQKSMWGLFSTKDIPKNSFVMEYCGEIITNREAEKRGKIYDLETISYLFDISSDCNEDFLNLYRFYCRKFGFDVETMETNMKLNPEDDFPLVIDAKEYGNQARFINHSCNPNLISVNVHKDCKDPRFASISLFAIEDIKAGTELTIDYFYESIPGAKDVYCLCLEKNCRNFLYSSR